jgi:ABC-type lipoprotein export system ATPase subunit
MKYNRGSEWRKWDLHLHTASSYDYEYKAPDADKKLCLALQKKEVAAVAITDHFCIDAARIKRLRELTPEITFFPGVELRTDKGSKSGNLHLILIFSETMDVDYLSNCFNVMMLQDKANSKDDNEEIYWNYSDIVEFAGKFSGLISIHAGNKSNGMDKEITNSVPVNRAIKEDISKSVDIFEVSRLQDIKDYHEHVFKHIHERPIIICSDCHDSRNYETKESLWIKANPTFEGLKQCLLQPLERVYVGDIPPAKSREKHNQKVIIDSLCINKNDSTRKESIKWFDCEIQLNSGLVAIIGNKGSGKSALSDVIGLAGNSQNMNYASFLRADRFKKQPKSYAKEYDAKLIWKDGQESKVNLNDIVQTTVEDVQYLPQQFIELICNDIEDQFQTEINKVIFSYVDVTERGDAKDLGSLVLQRTKHIVIEENRIKDNLSDINNKIIELERKNTNQYKKHISDGLKKKQEDLDRHNKAKPKEIIKQNINQDECYINQLQKYDKLIIKLDEEQKNYEKELLLINEKITSIKSLISMSYELELSSQELNDELKQFINKYNIEGIHEVKLSTPKNSLEILHKSLQQDKEKNLLLLNGEDPTSNSVVIRRMRTNEAREKLVAGANHEERKYQQYLKNLKKWEGDKAEIIGTENDDDSLSYFESESKYLTEQLKFDYEQALKKRIKLTKQLLKVKGKIREEYEDIYFPIAQEIEGLLNNQEEKIEFGAQISINNHLLKNIVITHNKLNYKGKFYGQKETDDKLSKLITNTDFSSEDNIIQLINEVVSDVYENLDSSESKIPDKQSYYDKLFGLSYLEVDYHMTMGGRSLTELSPGERGIVLLMFYLALSKSNLPIIIDQPEDNLDNQSVFNRLVPCICKAKKNRQVIIVTHNPNIAIACDAEQIIFSAMDKQSISITYETGAIEEKRMRDHVINVLEGTMPAFDLRSSKYHLNEI